jgi:hypothetical protein
MALSLPRSGRSARPVGSSLITLASRFRLWKTSLHRTCLTSVGAHRFFQSGPEPGTSPSRPILLQKSKNSGDENRRESKCEEIARFNGLATWLGKSLVASVVVSVAPQHDFSRDACAALKKLTPPSLQTFATISVRSCLPRCKKDWSTVGSKPDIQPRPR